MNPDFIPPISTGAGQWPRVVLHEVIAGRGHLGAAVSFGVALAAQTFAAAAPDTRLLWVRAAGAAAEAGEAYGPGLMALGFDASHLVLARLRTHTDTLRAGLEGARCPALGAVVLETIEPVDLTASRRLKLAAEKSRGTVVLIRLSDQPMSNAAQIRWRVCSASMPTTPDSQGRPAFSVMLLKHPSGLAGKHCVVEWDHDRRNFVEALSEPVAAVLDAGPLAA